MCCISTGLYCSEGWQSFRKRCLLTFWDEKTYNNAEKKCENEEARLLSLADEDELEEFSEIVNYEGMLTIRLNS